MKSTKKIWLYASLIIFIFVLSACSLPTTGSDEPTPTEIDPDAIFTSAVATVEAQLTETALSFSPTAEPITETPTQLSTATQININTPLPNPAGGVATATLPAGVPTFTPGVPTLFPTATRPPTSTAVGGAICDEMTYGSPIDTTYPDGSEVYIKEDFKKVWRVYNTGVCTWDEGYRLVPISSSDDGNGYNNPLDAYAVEFSRAEDFVRPGDVKDIGLILTAPGKTGTYSTCFRLQNDRGAYFGGILCVKVVAIKRE